MQTEFNLKTFNLGCFKPVNKLTAVFQLCSKDDTVQNCARKTSQKCMLHQNTCTFLSQNYDTNMRFIGYCYLVIC